MATKSPTWLTLLDRAIRTQNGTTISVVEAMNRSNPIIDIMPVVPANMSTHHIFNRRTSLPTIDWLSVGEGKSFGKSGMTSHQETLGFAGKLSRVPDDLVKMCESMQEAAALRAGEDLAFVEACSQEMAGTLFYGDTSSAVKEINGFATRRATLNATDNMGNVNVIGQGGTSSNLTSCYIVEFGPGAIQGMVPKNFPAGVNIVDKGKKFIQDPDDTSKYADFWITEFGFATGLIEFNDRCLRRYCNIKVSGSSNLFDPDKLIAQINMLPSKGRNAFIFLSPALMTQIEVKNKDYVKEGDMFGRTVPTFQGTTPFVMCDAISDSETQVS